MTILRIFLSREQCQQGLCDRPLAKGAVFVRVEASSSFLISVVLHRAVILPRRCRYPIGDCCRLDYCMQESLCSSTLTQTVVLFNDNDTAGGSNIHTTDFPKGKGIFLVSGPESQHTTGSLLRPRNQGPGASSHLKQEPPRTMSTTYSANLRRHHRDCPIRWAYQDVLWV